MYGVIERALACEEIGVILVLYNHGEERLVGAGGYQFSAHSVRRWTRCLGGLLGPLSGTQTK